MEANVANNNKAKKADVSKKAELPAAAKSAPTPVNLDAVRVALDPHRGVTVPTREIVAKVSAALKKAGVDVTPVLNRSVVGGLNVQGFQNALYIMNARDGWHFTDPVLALAWSACLPANDARVGKDKGGFITDPTKYVGGTRTLFNGGKHGPLPAGMVMVKSMRYIGAKPQPTAQPTQPTKEEKAA